MQVPALEMMDKPIEPVATDRGRWKRLFIAELILLAVLAVVLPAVMYFGFSRSGGAGALAALVAFALCWLPNALALLLMAYMGEPQESVSAMFLGMMLRMGIPLAFMVVLFQSRHWLVQVGVLPMIVVFYLAALVVETLLSLWVSGASRDRLIKAS